jgi:hypothetical protein
MQERGGGMQDTEASGDVVSVGSMDFSMRLLGYDSVAETLYGFCWAGTLLAGITQPVCPTHELHRALMCCVFCISCLHRYDDVVTFLDPITKYNNVQGYMFNIRFLKKGVCNSMIQDRAIVPYRTVL